MPEESRRAFTISEPPGRDREFSRPAVRATSIESREDGVCKQEKRRHDSLDSSQEEQLDLGLHQRRRLAEQEPSKLMRDMRQEEVAALQEEVSRVRAENEALRSFAACLRRQHSALAGEAQRWRVKCGGLEAEVGVLFAQLQQLVALTSTASLLDATAAADKLRALGGQEPVRAEVTGHNWPPAAPAPVPALSAPATHLAAPYPVSSALAGLGGLASAAPAASPDRTLRLLGQLLSLAGPHARQAGSAATPQPVSKAP